MRNKRGISQAFAQPAPPFELRRATVFDVFAMNCVLTASIRDLCHADHGGDPVKIADWLANKSPDRIRRWFDGPGEYWLATMGGEAVAVGAIADIKGRQGSVILNYVAPDFRFQGISSRMLAHLEARLHAAGAAEGCLTSTATARQFYAARGWRPDGTLRSGRWSDGYPMRKVLA
ncbi:GNAT family N-acetyltransferase [Roseobacteraceae bacterium NS-SX3]